MSENYLLSEMAVQLWNAKSLRENGYTGNIYLLSDLLEPAYNPMLITYFASGKIEYDAMFPMVAIWTLYSVQYITLFGITCN